MPPASGPRKVVKKVRVVKAPAGDIGSSGGDYGKKRAAPTVKRELKAIRVKQSQVKDTKAAADLARAPAYVKAHPKKKGGGSPFGAALSTVADVGAAALAPGLAGVAAAADKTLGTKILPGASKAIRNAPADAAEIATTTPSSLAKLSSTAIHDPEKVPGLLLAPYKELYHHPGKFITEKPVTTLLMVSPAGKMPGRIVGKVARATGKQTLERTASTLPGTALKETRTGSRDFVVRKLQAKVDAKKGQRTMTVRQVQKRVDEAFGAQQKHGERVKAAVARDAVAKSKTLPEAERKAFLEEQQSAAGSAARVNAQRAYAQEFGATAYKTPEGVIVKPKTEAPAALHATEADAKAVADALNRKPLTIKHGGFTKAEKLLPMARQDTPVKFTVSKVGDKHAVIPDIVSGRLTKQEKVGSSMAPGSKILRMSRGMFTRAVLPSRPTWLTGQAIEGVGRNLVSGAGPTSYLRTRKVVAAMERQNPGSGKALLDRAVPAGKIGKVMKEFAGERRTFADEFPDNPLAHALTAIGKTPGYKQVRDLNAAAANVVFAHVNARFLEGVPQTAQLGKALKNSPLMEKSILGLSDKAIEDAAKGLQSTPAQVELARAVQRGYGKYSNFGPALRESIVHWTPFIPWTLNAVRFLTTVLPKDHPVLSALIADANAAEEDWRKAHRLSLRSTNRLPFFDMGGYPTDGGKSVLRLGHYTPFGAAANPAGDLPDVILPQFSGLYGAVKYGLDWKGQPLRHADQRPYNGGEKWLYGLGQLAESMIPLASQTHAVVSAKNKPRELQHQFRVVSSTRVKPKNAGSSSSEWGAPSSSTGSGWGAPSTSKSGWGG